MKCLYCVNGRCNNDGQSYICPDCNGTGIISICSECGIEVPGEHDMCEECEELTGDEE